MLGPYLQSRKVYHTVKVLKHDFSKCTQFNTSFRLPDLLGVYWCGILDCLHCPQRGQK